MQLMKGFNKILTHLKDENIQVFMQLVFSSFILQKYKSFKKRIWPKPKGTVMLIKQSVSCIKYFRYKL
jgi:hypothetical protein